ncbi:flavodoxin reductase [Marixanthomonas sp. SCSIO 43207]|uniref:FAD-binding oxidoreductase n=1 Tax=Marixanthomonas sp. SCSIO 43207 TaxID=2779360 RepID=UPI001CA9F933|nr:FAD-binding oxidoreductase [Marixanthomonas sp. SCSIO 43207]UAB82409.1 flavodoxin reductase [Marixanthomonas sp. SCSIO 43207]
MGGFIFPYRSKILQKKEINHNIVRFHIDKPYGYAFTPGQAIDLSIDQKGFELDVAPFTITNTIDQSFLELYIKISPHQDSLSYSLASLQAGAILQISEPYDNYKYEGKGVFIAAGTGIMPFIAIFKSLIKSNTTLTDHKLIYTNKRKKDILFKSELTQLFGKNYINILTKSKAQNMVSGRIDIHFLKAQIKNLNQQFYICGPKQFEKEIMQSLIQLGAKKSYIQTGYNL